MLLFLFRHARAKPVQRADRPASYVHRHALDRQESGIQMRAVFGDPIVPVAESLCSRDRRRDETIWKRWGNPSVTD